MARSGNMRQGRRAKSKVQRRVTALVARPNSLDCLGSRNISKEGGVVFGWHLPSNRFNERRISGVLYPSHLQTWELPGWAFANRLLSHLSAYNTANTANTAPTEATKRSRTKLACAPGDRIPPKSLHRSVVAYGLGAAFRNQVSSKPPRIFEFIAPCVLCLTAVCIAAASSYLLWTESAPRKLVYTALIKHRFKDALRNALQDP